MSLNAAHFSTVGSKSPFSSAGVSVYVRDYVRDSFTSCRLDNAVRGRREQANQAAHVTILLSVENERVHK